MRHLVVLLVSTAHVALGTTIALTAQVASQGAALWPVEISAQVHAKARLRADLAAVREFRPAYPFWQHIFVIPDGRIVYGSAADGRLLATFPTRGDWSREAIWEEQRLSATLSDRRLPSRLTQRREEVERLLELAAGPVVHNPTRGRFLSKNADRYGRFLSEWGAIYERFGVPAEIGLSQAIIESGLNGRARSSARALGFCQWLPRNWAHLNRLTPYVIEGYNQTTQAPYCAAHLTILATMYGSYIPALSEHHAGGVNVGRTVINGKRLGGKDTREQYLIGSEFARSLREISRRRYRELFRSYGPRSALYAEMVFGNTFNVMRLIAETPQSPVFAMRVARSISIAELSQRTGLSTDELKRFNPALVRQVPAQANLYLPWHAEEFGPDVSFWHRAADPGYAAILNDFVRLEAGVEQWHEASFEPILKGFQTRFEATDTEEGVVMAAMLAYVIGDLRMSPRAAILDEFQTSSRILSLFREGVRELAALFPSGK